MFIKKRRQQKSTLSSSSAASDVYKEQDKDGLIQAELKKYKKPFKKIAKDRKPLAEKLCQQAAFMAVTLADLQAQVNEKGAIINAKNGNGFDTTMENPAQKSYNIMIKNYNATIKTLVGLLPADVETKDDELINFRKRGDPK